MWLSIGMVFISGIILGIIIGMEIQFRMLKKDGMIKNE